MFSKVFEKLINNRTVDHLDKCGHFYNLQFGIRSSWSTTVLLKVVSDRLATGLNRSGATWAVALDICKAFNRGSHAGLLHKLTSYEIQVSYLVLFLLFSVIEGFGWFWMRSLHKNIQLMLDFLKVRLLVLKFASYKLVTFLLMLSVTLRPILMVLSALSVIRYLVYGNNQNRLLNLNLIYKTLWTGEGSGALVSN